MKSRTVFFLTMFVAWAAIAIAQTPEGPPDHRARRSSGTKEQSLFENPPRAKDEAEAKVLKAMEEIQQTQGWRLNVPMSDGRLLRLIAETIDAKSVIEIGTSNGISSIWIAMALKKTGGKLVTHEIDPKTAALARKNFAKAGVADIVTVVEGDAHKTVSKLKGPIDMVFIDADKQGYSDYLKKVLPLVRAGGIVFAHNVTPHMADSAFLKAITNDPDLETAFFTQGAGMSLTMKKR
jgi:predicted O-methyltransferase YrrM